MYISPRSIGKTVYLLYESCLSNTPILCISSQNKKWLKNKSNQIGVNIPDPISLDKLKKIML